MANSSVLGPEVSTPASLQDMRGMLATWRGKDGEYKEAVRLLDQAEVTGMPFGKTLTLQVLSYATYEWVPCVAPGRKAMRSLAEWYRFIRQDLGWSGPVRVAVAEPEGVE